MASHDTLNRLRELILREYYSSPHSWVTYARRVPFRNGSDSRPIDILEAHGAADRAQQWRSLIALAQPDWGAKVSFTPISECPEPTLPEFLISPERDLTPTKRFLDHLQKIGRYLNQCGIMQPPYVPSLSRILAFCLDVAGRDPVGSLLSVQCYFAPPSGDEFHASDQCSDLASMAVRLREQLDWPAGDYFFVLGGDARVAVIQLLEAFLNQHSPSGEGSETEETLRDRLELILAVFDDHGPGPFRAKKIAKLAQLSSNADLRADLSQLKTLKYLENDGTGYIRTCKPYRPMSVTPCR